MTERLRIVSNTFKPWISFQNGLDSDCNGIQCDLIKYLSKSMNFTYEFIEGKIGTGHKLSNGSWTRTIGRLHRNEADITGFPIAMNVEPVLDNIVEHTVPFAVDESTIIIRYDTSWSSFNFEDLVILDKASWVFTFIALIYFIITIVLLHRDFLIQRQSVFQRSFTVTLHLIGTLLYQDIKLNKIFMVKISTIILMSSWLLSSTELSRIVSSELTARFSLKIPNQQINSLKELLDSKMSLIVYATFNKLHNVRDKDVFNRIQKKIEQDHSIVQIDEMFRDKNWIINTSKGKAAIFLATFPLKMLTITHSKHLMKNTKFHFLDESYRNPFLVTIVSSTRMPKKFRIMLNFKVLQYTSTGIINQQLKQILTKSDPFFDYKENVYAHYKQINMDNLLGLFKITIILLVMCMMIFILEVSIYLTNFQKSSR